MHRLLFLPLLIFLFACNGRSDKSGEAGKIYSIKDNKDGGEEITCWGIGEVDLDNDFASLEEKVGKENISNDSLLRGGAFDGFVTRLWKGTNREIVVHWKEKKPPFSNIDFLEISQSSSPYHFVNGIRIGSSLNEVVKLNGGKPVSIRGFGGDNGGALISFNKGKLAGDIPCFGGVFVLPGNVKPEESKPVTGDKEVSSSEGILQKYELKLASIRVKNL